MNSILNRKKVTTIIFMVCLIIYSGINIMKGEFVGRYAFMEGYGLYQNILGKNEYNNFKYVKDKDGFMYYGAINKFDNEWYLEKIASSIKNLSEKYSDIKFLVATPPDRAYDGKINGYLGMDYTNSTLNIDVYYEYLKKYGIDTLDYRNDFIEFNYIKEDLYYKSDHHWTTRGAFLAFQTMVDKLKKDGVLLENYNYYTDINNYKAIKYEERFLGSYGRSMGYVYTGIDDYEFLLPKFNTLYTFEKIREDGTNQKITGSFEDVLINKEILNSDASIYEQDIYSAYCDGVLYPLGKITNMSNNNGPRILLIRDSYSSSFAAFLSTVCSEVDLLYPFYDVDFDEVISSNNYDYVIFSGYCGTLGNELYDRFVEKYSTK